jgi:choline-sulfatase
VPLILRGAGLPACRRVSTPVTLVDSHPTILEATGVAASPEDADLPGRSLLGFATGPEVPDRTAFSEYHAVASITGYYMVRWGRFKYVHYEGYAPQLFDLDADPGELTDLSGDPAHAATRAEGDRRLRAICDPTEVNALAFADQKRRIAELGGVEKVMSLRSYPYTPAPGEAPRYS